MLFIKIFLTSDKVVLCLANILRTNPVSKAIKLVLDPQKHM